MKEAQYSFILRRLATILAVVVLTLSLTAAITGVLLAFYYEPTAGGAHNSLATIANEIPNGWLIQRSHNIAGNMVIGVSLIQIVVMFLGERFNQNWLTAWISGIFFTLTAIGLGWTAMLLDWSQVGYWRFRIELGTIESIPAVGSLLREIITGGGAVNTMTVQHLFTLHSYVLAIAAIMLAVVHLVSVVLQERADKIVNTESSSTVG